MLSAFTARPVIELKQRDKSKIEAILAYGDRVLVGLNTGSLRIYRVNEFPPAPSNNPTSGTVSSAPSKSNASSNGAAVKSEARATPSKDAPAARPSDLLREVDRFSARAIERLAAIKEANILVSLSNYAVSLHDLQTFQPLESPLPGTKNASTLAVTSNIVKDPSTGIPEIISRLAVAVKRKLLLWSWRESELASEADEIVLPESIRSVTWASAANVVCGMNGGYVIVDVNTRDVQDVVGPGTIGGAAGGPGSRFGAVSVAGMGYMGLGGYAPKPLAAKLADGELLLAKDINTLFIDDSGKALDKRQIPWGGAPEDIGYSYPYILALQAPSRGCLEIRNPDTLSLLQTITLPGAAALHFPPPTMSLAHAGKGFHVLSGRTVWKMDATDYDSQVTELVTAGKLDEAISILNMLEDALLSTKTETLREVKMLKAERLFRQKKYRESMDLFNDEEVHAPPARVLKLFPREISGDLSEVKDREVKDDKGEESDHERSDGKHHDDELAAEASKQDAPAVEGASSQQRGAGLAKYLIGHRRASPETASIVSSKRSQDEDETASVKGNPCDDTDQSEKDTMAAVLELNGYLAGTRVRLKRLIDPETGKLKPRDPKDASAEGGLDALLLSAPQDEDTKQLEEELRQTFKTVDTALFRAYMYSSPSLAGPLFRISNCCDPDVVNEVLVKHNRYNELVDFLYGKKLHRKALELLKRFGAAEEPDRTAPALHGPRRTVVYLQNLPPEMIDLILEYSEWALRKDPQLAMEVFLADSENAETLPRARVAKFLGEIDSGLEVQYLEHIIAELGDKTPDFHNRLVEQFIELLRHQHRGKEWSASMERLVRFLQDSDEYRRRWAYQLIPKEDPTFYEAQVVVLSRMEQHRQALDIYVSKMKDYGKAEEYCNRIYKSREVGPTPSAERDPGPAEEADDPQASVYHTLLTLYLKPPEGHEPNLGPALELLSKHGSRLSAEKTLPLIPDNLPVTRLESYFRGRMRSANSVVNEMRIVAGLGRTSLVASQARLLLGDGTPGRQGGKNRRVVISDERVCGVCYKRLGGSVVAVLPDNSAVHYGCLARARSDGGASMPTARVAGGWGRSGGAAA